jgi:hypothetical protein
MAGIVGDVKQQEMVQRVLTRQGSAVVAAEGVAQTRLRSFRLAVLSAAACVDQQRQLQDFKFD